MWRRLRSGPVIITIGAGSGLGSMLFCSIYCTLDIFGPQGDAEGIRRCRREGDGIIPRILEIVADAFGSPVRRRIGEISLSKVQRSRLEPHASSR